MKTIIIENLDGEEKRIDYAFGFIAPCQDTFKLHLNLDFNCKEVIDIDLKKIRIIHIL